MSDASALDAVSAPSPRPAPGPPGLPFLGSYLEIRRRGQIGFYLESWHRYGDIIRFRLGPLVVHIIAHPDHVHHVLAGRSDNYIKGWSYTKLRIVAGLGLLTSEGELWRRQRRLIQPPFTQRSVARLGPDMNEAIDAMLARWQVASDSGTPLAIDREMAALGLSIIGKTIFGTDLSTDMRSILDAVADALAFVNRRLASFLDVPLAVPTPANRRFKRAMARFDAVVYGLIEERRRRVSDESDLLGALLAARDPETGEAMSDRQIRDEVITILIAGHETSALALSWTWYLLAQHPEVEDRLLAELATVLAGRPPTIDDVPALTYTRMVAEEAMRLYPPVWTFSREAVADDEIAGYYIPGGSIIFLSQYLTHRHPDFWERPEEFDPERFSPERAKDRPHYVYFPFGFGSRGCLGFHFAMLELCLTLASVAQRYRLRSLPGPSIEPRSRITLHPSRDLLMTVTAR
jgi:cytochrome P450